MPSLLTVGCGGREVQDKKCKTRARRGDIAETNRSGVTIATVEIARQEESFEQSNSAGMPQTSQQIEGTKSH